MVMVLDLQDIEWNFLACHREAALALDLDTSEAGLELRLGKGFGAFLGGRGLFLRPRNGLSHGCGIFILFFFVLY
jgi:hypothetical protein